MVEEIVDLASNSNYDFRQTACPDDPLKHLFEEWVSYYRLKWAIIRVLRPQRILEIGVRFGYSAAAFLDASPDSEYFGIDNDSNTFSGQKGAINWARRITHGSKAEFLIADSQQFDAFPGGHYDLIHIDGHQDGAGSSDHLRKALKQATHVLVDGYFSTRENFLHISEFLYRYRDLIETYVVIPGYAGELLITPRPSVQMSNRVTNSAELRNTYTASYYLQDCGGFDAYKRDRGVGLSEWRLQSIAHVAEIAPIGRALDLGCGRGELSVHFARAGYEVLAVDYSENAISLAQDAATSAGCSSINFYCGDVNDAPLTGLYDVAVASDLIEHLTPGEVDRLYDRIASHLSPYGIFIVHTFPNAWYYKYEHSRRLREAQKLGAYLPLNPRSRYEELMHINEQSPRVLKRQLCAHFGHVLFWFAAHDLANPFENLKRRFRKSELRSAGDLFALASHSRIDATALLDKLEMHPLPAPIDLAFQVLEIPSMVRAGARFRARVRLINKSRIDLKSRPPNPVHLSYHCSSENGESVVFDGIRTRVPAVIQPGSAVDIDMNIEAPCANGTFLFRMTLVQEWVRWFDTPPQSLFVDEWIQVK